MKKPKSRKTPSQQAVTLDHYQEMQQAIRYAEQANWQAAETICKQIVARNPRHIDAINMLGVVAIKRSQWPLAVQLMQKLIHLKPDYLNAYINLGMVMREQGDLEGAARYCRQALKLKPDCAEAYSNLGNALLGLNRAAEAVAAYEAALKINPGFWDAVNNLSVARRAAAQELPPSPPGAIPLSPGPSAMSLASDAMVSRSPRPFTGDPLPANAPELTVSPAEPGKAESGLSDALQRLRTQLGPARPAPQSDDYAKAIGLLGQGRIAEATELLQAVLHRDPKHVDARGRLADLQIATAQYESARQTLEELLRLQPENAGVHCNLASVLISLERFAEALPHCRKAVELAPHLPEARNNLGLALCALQQPEAAEESYRHALQLRPDFPEALDNLATALKEQGRNGEAVACLREALRLKPEFAEAHFKLGLILLHEGRFDEGFREQEWRFRVDKHRLTSAPEPRWLGQPFAAQTLCVHCEQGLGDAIQFVRSLRDAKERGGRLILRCYPSLLRLFKNAGLADEVLSSEAPMPAADWHISLLSLPGLFSSSPEGIPAPIPYLFPDARKAEDFARRLSAIEGFKLGVVWSGNPQFSNDARRSIPLRQLEPLARIPGIALISLQKGPAAEHVREHPLSMSLTDWTCELEDFADTAALITGLDLIISVDTSVAHLAGALGKPVWTLLPFPPDWRWLAVRDDTPWYPHMRLFRKAYGEDWDRLMARVAEALATYGDGRTRAEGEHRRPPGTSGPILRDDLVRAAANYLPAGASVLDVGCTRDMSLAALLPEACQYLPCDPVPVDANTQVCDLIGGQLPELGSATHAVLLDVLERIADPRPLLTHLRRSGGTVVLSYRPREWAMPGNPAPSDRVNHYSQEELAGLLAEAGYRILDGGRLGDALLMGLSGEASPALPRPRILLVSSGKGQGFGFPLRQRLIHAILPPGAETTVANLDAGPVPAGDYDLAIIGNGGDWPWERIDGELLALSERVPRVLGIFGLPPKAAGQHPRLEKLLDRLFIWCARFEEDVLVHGRGRSNVLHFGDWLVDAFPLRQGQDEALLQLDAAGLQGLAPDELTGLIGKARRVQAGETDSLLCALCSAEEVAYEAQGGAQRMGALLHDVFGRRYGPGQSFAVNRDAVARYKQRIRLLIDELRKALATALNISLP